MRELILDFSSVETSQSLHEVLAKALRFPDYYGANWDAFWDVIAPGDYLPERLVLRGWYGMQERLPRDADLLLRCLADYRAGRPNHECAVLLQTDEAPTRGLPFEVEKVLSVRGRDYVLVRRLSSDDFSLTDRASLGGQPIENWLDIPRALNSDGSPRLDLHLFCLRAEADSALFKVSELAFLRADAGEPVAAPDAARR